LNGKYKECIELCDEMTARLSHKRPDCEDILKRKNLWVMSEEIELNNDLKYFIDSKESESTIYSMLKCLEYDYVSILSESCIFLEPDQI
jgi:hypothetical protein